VHRFISHRCETSANTLLPLELSAWFSGLCCKKTEMVGIREALPLNDHHLNVRYNLFNGIYSI